MTTREKWMTAVVAVLAVLMLVFAGVGIILHNRWNNALRDRVEIQAKYEKLDTRMKAWLVEKTNQTQTVRVVQPEAPAVADTNAVSAESLRKQALGLQDQMAVVKIAVEQVNAAAEEARRKLAATVVQPPAPAPVQAQVVSAPVSVPAPVAPAPCQVASPDLNPAIMKALDNPSVGQDATLELCLGRPAVIRELRRGSQQPAMVVGQPATLAPVSSSSRYDNDKRFLQESIAKLAREVRKKQDDLQYAEWYAGQNTSDPGVNMERRRQLDEAAEELGEMENRLCRLRQRAAQ